MKPNEYGMPIAAWLTFLN